MRNLLILAAVIAMSFLLGGCGSPGTAVETRVQIERVPVRAKCPDEKTYAALVAAQPVPLREGKMPADPDVRVAVTQAQLGKYEARGGWADKARAALDRCQEGPDLTTVP